MITKIYTLKQVAELLQVSRQTIYNYIKAGKLRATATGKEYRVTNEQLEAFINENTVNTKQQR